MEPGTCLSRKTRTVDRCPGGAQRTQSLSTHGLPGLMAGRADGQGQGQGDVGGTAVDLVQGRVRPRQGTVSGTRWGSGQGAASKEGGPSLSSGGAEPSCQGGSGEMGIPGSGLCLGPAVEGVPGTGHVLPCCLAGPRWGGHGEPWRRCEQGCNWSEERLGRPALVCLRLQGRGCADHPT